ncbi:MAG TPA: helix-turn-helix domain-containing protein [Rhodospirillales bacterium]|jgi:putative transcriptional regulator|nr:helix-turn-helix domain-containing protein [Rhodospirillales bacterium]
MSTKKLSRGKSKVRQANWKKIDATTEAGVAAQIAADPDTAPDVSTLGKGRIVRPPDQVDVHAIRKKLRMSQECFARRYGFSVWSVRNWEQGRRRPEGPARLLLRVIESDPEAIDKALSD